MFILHVPNKYKTLIFFPKSSPQKESLQNLLFWRILFILFWIVKYYLGKKTKIKFKTASGNANFEQLQKSPDRIHKERKRA